MRARVRSDEGRNLKFCRSVDEEAVMVARVHEHDLEVRNLRRRVEDFSETIEARGRASSDRISGFGRHRWWSMSMVLVSSGKAWICTDLIS